MSRSSFIVRVDRNGCPLQDPTRAKWFGMSALLPSTSTEPIRMHKPIVPSRYQNTLGCRERDLRALVDPCRSDR